MPIDLKQCLECKKPVKGRTDKKFCDDACRNVYNNRINSHSNVYIKNIVNALKRNRRILEETLPANEDIMKTTREKLLSKGFNFTYLTHTYKNKKGNVYYFCFDFGYLFLDGDWLLIVKRKQGS